MITGEELIRRRTALGITQTELMKRSGVTRNDICRQERGRGDLGPITSAKVRHALDALEAEQLKARKTATHAEAAADFGRKLVTGLSA